MELIIQPSTQDFFIKVLTITRWWSLTLAALVTYLVSTLAATSPSLTFLVKFLCANHCYVLMVYILHLETAKAALSVY